MYGLINKGIEDYILDHYGAKAWSQITLAAGVPNIQFISWENYDDALSYRLFCEAATFLQVPREDLLRKIGKYWMKITAAEGYGEILHLFGRDFNNALLGLNSMHLRLGMLMSKLRPPRFEVEFLSPTLIKLSYFSERPDLAPMVMGMLEGLAERFQTAIEIELERKGEHNISDRFFIRILSSLLDKHTQDSSVSEADESALLQ